MTSISVCRCEFAFLKFIECSSQEYSLQVPLPHLHSPSRMIPIAVGYRYALFTACLHRFSAAPILFMNVICLVYHQASYASSSPVVHKVRSLFCTSCIWLIFLLVCC
ncbi:hypothetical protein B0H16DRAFT_1521648 [Mycena metata]|uniref:Uncharacterized protein n=1 Tax=Mycena metata TaxID=1033252 RepID=A0AAD7MM06_9AGAR|nr:hypothetical protein B0H16DRAFT_1598153 [Mycena metata]KAJ7723666.1 hypothetical protein B0H16DRAFT_1598163 [Mycena metata]KAJ7761833.1 hypothetical protein B0H16DRAFT_1530693 [Mycena metata]KAJ7767309.1 hypothetical protein B0H16DRAFT_1521648 [Mycena metata]